MTSDDNAQSSVISRRILLRGAALAATGGGVLLSAGLAATDAAAQTKISQKLASYRNTPKGNARCDGCIQWQGPSFCKIVQGVISPAGWCQLYAPKLKS